MKTEQREDLKNWKLPPQRVGSYRDELNFAEFPIASLGERVPHGVKTLDFNDTIFDQGRKAPVTRKLTVSASDRYGLPTALDDEVILGLIQLTSRQCFSARKVHFTLYELVKLLGWRDEGRSYVRLARSLNRWLGVTLYYERAWWAKEERAFVSENFHILDQVTVYDRDRRESRKRSRPGDPNAARSSFAWNEKVFESFLAGNLKQLDFEFFKSLESAIAKRLFRFLDKRFYHRDRLEFGLREFACEHIGLARSNPNSEIKRLFAGPIRELEEKGFLRKLRMSDRYQEVSRGSWRVVFIADASFRTRKKGIGATESELVSRGVSPEAAVRLTDSHDPELVREKVRHFDTLRNRNDLRASKNPPGFLVRAIEKDYAVEPPDTPKPVTLVREVRREIVAKKPDRLDVLSALWQSLPDEERRAVEADGVKNASAYRRKLYAERREEGGPLFEATRVAIAYRELERRLSR